MQINQPYSFFTEESEGNGIDYLFRTDNNVVYTVYFNLNEYDKFLQEFPVLLHNSFGVGFFRNVDSFKGRDHRVFQTIESIIADFLSSQQSDIVVLYHCQTNDDNSDQAKREKAFQRRYENSVFKDEFVKKSLQVDLNINENIVPHYVGFFSKYSNPCLEQAYEEMESFAFHMAEENITK